MKKWREMAKELTGADLKQSLQYTCMAGLLAHGFMLFNKLSWRGDLEHGFVLPQEKAISLGRWLKSVLCILVSKVFNGKNMSLPLIYGLVSILLIALSAHVILHLLDIRRKSLRMALCAMMVVFPVVTSTLAYMFDAPYYFFGMLMAVLGVYIAANRPRWDGFIAGTVLVGGCLSIYQAYFPVAVSLFVITLIREIATDRHETFGKAILRGVYYLGICVGSLILFFVSWKVIMKLTGVTANSYQGASSIGESGLMSYVEAVGKAYWRFLFHFGKGSRNLYPMKLAWVQRVLLVASGLGGLVIALRHFRKNKLLAVLMLALIALLPLCFNLVYVMVASSPSDAVYVYTLMLYGQCMLYVFLAFALDFLLGLRIRKLDACCRGVVAVLAVMICLNIYLDNVCYNKAEFMLEQSINQANVMVARIKSTEGYRDTMPVAFVWGSEPDSTIPENEWFDDILLVPFDQITPYPYKQRLRDVMERWCGFAPEWAHSAEFKEREEVVQMPSYPNDGGIIILDDTVIVKWCE